MRYLLLFVFGLPMAVHGQRMELSFTAGLATHAMSDFKRQQQLAQVYFQEGKVTSSFPAYWYYEGSVMITFKNGFVTGQNFSYTSTGGRISYSDYSGARSIDHLTSCLSFSAIVGKEFRFMEESLLMKCSLYPGVTFTDYQVITKNTIAASFGKDRVDAAGFNIFAQPSIRVTKRFWYLGATAELGYYLAILKGKLFIDTQTPEPTYLKDDFNNPIQADWSGLRMSLGVSVYFSGIKKA